MTQWTPSARPSTCLHVRDVGTGTTEHRVGKMSQNFLNEMTDPSNLVNTYGLISTCSAQCSKVPSWNRRCAYFGKRPSSSNSTTRPQPRSRPRKPRPKPSNPSNPSNPSINLGADLFDRYLSRIYNNAAHSRMNYGKRWHAKLSGIIGVAGRNIHTWNHNGKRSRRSYLYIRHNSHRGYIFHHGRHIRWNCYRRNSIECAGSWVRTNRS